MNVFVNAACKKIKFSEMTFLCYKFFFMLYLIPFFVIAHKFPNDMTAEATDAWRV